MMSDKKAVKVGDRVSFWEIYEDRYTGCEFKRTGAPKLSLLEITKAPEVSRGKPEVPDEPMTRGDVVTIEGDDAFIAVRFTVAGDLSYPFIASYSDTRTNDVSNWDEIVYLAAGRKIIVHKMVDPNGLPNPNGVPNRVDTYSEWLTLPKDGLSKYKWLDTDGDLWIINDQSGKFEVDGVDDGIFTLGEEYFPLTLDDKIG